MSFKVVESKSGVWYISLGGLFIILLLLSGWFGWKQGGARTVELSHQLTIVSGLHDELKLQVATLQQQLLEIERREKIALVSVKQSSEDMLALQEQTKQLEKELSFYRSIMAPELGQSGLTIDSLKVIPESGGRYYFELVLTQTKKQDWYLKGSFNLSLLGKQHDKAVTLPMKSLIMEENWKPEFSFRYFQKIEGRFQLPENVTIASVSVTASTKKGKQRVEKNFPWSL